MHGHWAMYNHQFNSSYDLENFKNIVGQQKRPLSEGPDMTQRHVYISNQGQLRFRKSQVISMSKSKLHIKNVSITHRYIKNHIFKNTNIHRDLEY